MTDSSSSTSFKLYCPIGQTWTITEQKLREIANRGEYFRIFSEFKEVAAVPNLKYRIKMLHGLEKPEKEAFFIYLDLYMPKPDSRIHAKFSFSIKSENYVTQFNHIFENDHSGWGDEICNVKEFFDSRRKFINDGNFTVEMKGILIVEVDEMPKVEMTPASSLVQQLWDRNDDKEFKIIVGDEGNLMIHKLVLCARSPHFEAMFRSGREEAKTNTLKIIDFNLKTVKAVVEFFYDRNIFENLDMNDAFELLRFADKYNIDDLQEKLELHFTIQISPSSVCQIANGSIHSNSIKLRQLCIDFMMTCSKHSIAINDLDILDKEFAAELFQKMFLSSST